MKKIILTMFFMSILAFSKDFWELSNFSVNVNETTSSGKAKSYTMVYKGGTLKITINSPSGNKGEVYTYSGSQKTIYYPSLKQTVTQNVDSDEANFLNIINMLKSVSGKNTVTKGGNKFVFSDSKLVSIETDEYTATFSGYTSSGGNTYPRTVRISENGKTKITFNLSNFK